MVTGKFNFESMIMAAPLLGPIVFFIFVLCTSIILVNIFLTLIISAFETVKRDVMKQNNEYEIIDFMMKKFKSMLGLYSFSADLFEEKMDEKQRKRKLIEEQIESLPAKFEQLRQQKIKNQSQTITAAAAKKQNEPIVLNVRGLDHRSLRSKKNRLSHQQSSDTSNDSKRSNQQKFGEEISGIQKVSFLDWNEVQD
mgnify:FL=1